MTNINRITILGHVGKHEPKCAVTATGIDVTRLTVATNKRFKDGEEIKNRCQWHHIAVFGGSAKYAAGLEPGTLVFIEGELTYREYERDVEGKRVQWPLTEIVASTISAIRPRRALSKPSENG